MDVNHFWKLIERSRKAATKKKDHAETLVAILATLDVEEIISFEQHFFNHYSEVHRNDLWLAFYLLNGGYGSDDGFKDFRSYLISKGRKFYTRVTHDPDSLADLVPETEYPSYEEFAYSADLAYNQVTGSHFSEDGVWDRIHPRGFVMWELTKPGGKELTLADTPTYLPKLRARFVKTIKARLARAKRAYKTGDPSARFYALSDFNHCAPHSPEAIKMLETAEKDRSKKVRDEAKTCLARHRKAAQSET